MKGLNLYANGSYCPSCGREHGSTVQPLSEWERLMRGRRCDYCGDELMPLEIDAADAYAAHCMNHPWD